MVFFQVFSTRRLIGLSNETLRGLRLEFESNSFAFTVVLDRICSFGFARRGRGVAATCFILTCSTGSQGCAASTAFRRFLAVCSIARAAGPRTQHRFTLFSTVLRTAVSISFNNKQLFTEIFFGAVLALRRNNNSDFMGAELMSFKDGSDERMLGVLDSSGFNPRAVGRSAPPSSNILSGIELNNRGRINLVELRP